MSPTSTQLSFDELGTPLRDVTFVVRRPRDHRRVRRRRDAITEIGAVKVRGGEVLGEFQTLVDPGAGDPAVHHRPHRHHRLRWSTDAPRIEAVLPAFLEFARGRVLVAHNAPFDVGFLQAACARHGRRLAAAAGAVTRRGSPAAC